MYFFNGWIQGIVVAVIITIIVEMILPEGNSKKYIKIVLGIFIVFSIISPIIGEVTGGKFEVSSIINMDKYAKELGIYEERVKDRKIENNNNENIIKDDIAFIIDIQDNQYNSQEYLTAANNMLKRTIYIFDDWLSANLGLHFSDLIA